MAYIDSSLPEPSSPLDGLDDDQLAGLADNDDQQPDEGPQRTPQDEAESRTRKARLVKRIDDINLARYLDNEELDRIGMQAVRDFNIDQTSRADWLARCEKVMRYAMQVTQPKSFPWPHASNVIFPIITQAALEFHARAYPAIIQGKKVVKGVIWGDDKGTPATTDSKPPKPDGSNVRKDPQTQQPVWVVAPGEKRQRADAISEHMSWQLLKEMPEWEPQTDQYLLQMPIVGGFVRTSRWSPVDKRNKSLAVPLCNYVWNYHATSFEACPRHSEIQCWYPHEIAEFERSGAEEEGDEGSWLHWDYGPGGGGVPAQYGWNSEWSAGDEGDEDAPHLFIAQNRMLDLDHDGLPEPYTVTVHLRSGKVVQIVARYDEEGILCGQKDPEEEGGKPVDNEDFIVAIRPRDDATLYRFFPNFEGGSYPLGFGHMLESLNSTINTALNQMFDAGTLANAGGGFISDQLGIASGQTLFQVGKYVRVNAKGAAIRDAVLPMDFKGPNSTLFQLLGLVLEAGKQLAGVTEILAGDASIANAPPTTVLALIEQGMKGYTAIHKRIYRAESEELAKLYALNRKHITEAQRYQIGDEFREITPHDYRLGGGVEPIADPTMTTDMQRLGRASVLQPYAADPTMNGQEIKRRLFEAAGIDRIDDLFAPPNPMMAQMQQMQAAQLQAELGKLRSEEQKNLTQAFLNMALARKNATDGEMGAIDQQLTYLRLQIEAMNADTKAQIARHNATSAMLGHAQQIEDRHHDRVQNALDRAHEAQQNGLDRQADAAAFQPGPSGAFPASGQPTPGPAVAKPAPGGLPSDMGGAPPQGGPQSPLQSLGPAGPQDMASLPGRATGGPLTPGQPTVVGENGPEVVVAGGDGMTVIPNGDGGGNPYGADPDDPNDMTNAYNTPLSPDQEQQFQAWARQNPRLGNTYDYDARGFWLHGGKVADNGHGDDAYKKPNHPTFSDLSNYHGPMTPGGHWAQSSDGSYTYTPNRANPHYIGDDDLRSYWDKVEAPAGNKLAMPRKGK